MRFDKTALLATLTAIALSAALPARARAQTFGFNPRQTQRYEASLGYAYLHANAPPGQCGCFSADGGFASAAYNLPRNLSIVADFSGLHASNLAATTQTITLFNYLFGPRYSWRSLSQRFVPYGQALGGVSHESSNLAYVQSVNGAAFSLGGGIAVSINRRFSWDAVQAEWVESRLPNAKNNLQNDLRIGSAIAFRFGSD